jgi:hypothetical protein
VSATTVRVVIGAGTPVGASSVELTFTNGAKAATVANTPLTVSADPTAASIAPTAAYAGSTITVTGANFISGFDCSAKVGATPASGTAAASCTYVSATTVRVVIGAGTPVGASSVELTFLNGFHVFAVSGSPLMLFFGPALDVSLFVSSHVSGHSGVVVSVSFRSPITSPDGFSKGHIKTISITGVFFASFSAVDEVRCEHQGLAVGTATFVHSFTDPTVVITLSSSSTIPPGASSIACVIRGFTNVATQRASSLSVGLTTWDPLNKPLDVASNVAFPNIFAFSASNGSVALSSQLVAKSGVVTTLSFNAPYTGQSIRSITASGLRFSASPQLSADCYVNLLANVVDANSVVYDAVAAEVRLTFISALSSGNAGSLLAIVCRIRNFVNSPDPVTSSNTVTFSAFGANAAPLYIHTAVIFPSVIEQSLGSNRPRVHATLC